jgi:hypothetical protein
MSNPMPLSTRRLSAVARALLVAACWSCLAAVVGCGADDDDTGPFAGSGGSGGGGAGGAGAGGRAGMSGVAGMGASCGTESFATIYQTIFASQTYGCNSPVCHGRMEGQTASVGNLELITKEAAYKDLVGTKTDSVSCGDGMRTRVVPGNAAASLLVQKLKSQTVMCGAIMPISGIPIADVDFARITAWINAGACNN